MSMDIQSAQRAPVTSERPVPAYSKLAICIRAALYGMRHPIVVRMCERNQMLRAVEKFGFAVPEPRA